MESLHERLRAVIAHVTHESRRFKELEEETGIASATWKTYWSRGSRPSSELIEAVAKRWPEYALWIATSEEDEEFGHLAPGRRDPKCNAGPYLKSSILEKQIARAILAKKYADADSQTVMTDKQKEIIEKYVDSAHQLIRPDDDIDGKYRAAATRKLLEEEKRRLEISNLTKAERTFLKSVHGYPYIDKDAVLAAVHVLLEEAEKEKTESGENVRLYTEELKRGGNQE